MTPQQQIQLGCKQLVEQTVKLRGWVAANAYDLQGLSAGLASELSDIERRAGDISRSSLADPAFAIIGSPEQSRREMILAIAGNAGGDLVVESSDGTIRADLNGLLPPPHTMAAAVRISRREPRQTRAGLAFPARILDRLDIVKILARAHLMGLSATHDAASHVKTLLKTIDAAQQGLSAYRVPGFSEPDVRDLIEYLNALCPNTDAIRNFTAAGYWEALLALLPHLEDQNRIPLLAALWGSDETMTRIYLKCSDAIERLGNGQALMLGHDALFAPDSSIEQNKVHPRSLIDRRTIEGLLEPISAMIDVSASYGRPQRVSRAVLTLLLRDIRFGRADVQWAASEAADTVLFPHPGQIPGKMLSAPIVRTVQHDADLALLRLLGHVKARYIFEQAVERHEINSLVVCCATSEQSTDDCLSEAVADWIDLTHGAEAHIREQARTSLYITTEPSDTTSAVMEASNWQDEIAPGQDWPLNWHPGRPFANIIPLSGADATSDHRSDMSSTASLRASDRPPSWQYAGIRHSNLREVQAPFTPSTRGPLHVSLKTRQLQRNLTDIQRRLRSRFLRFIVSDPQNVPEWRRRMANVSQSRLVLCAQQNRIGALLQAISPREQDLELMLGSASEKRAATHAGTPAFEIDESASWPPPAEDERRHDDDLAQDMASTIVNCWVEHMRRSARSQTFTRRVRLPSIVLSHIVDEIVIASERIGVRGELTSRIRAILAAQPSQSELALRAAAQSSRFIAVFLETLQAPDPIAETAQRVLASTEYSAAHHHRRRDGFRSAPATSATLSDTWPRAFSGLVEDNLATVQSVARGGERERALHQLLNELNATAIEVEL